MNLYSYLKNITEAEKGTDDFSDTRDNDIILRDVTFKAVEIPGGEATAKEEAGRIGTINLNELEEKIKNRSKEYVNWTLTISFKMRGKAYSIEFTFKKQTFVSVNDIQKESKDHPILRTSDFKKIKNFDNILNFLRDEWNGKWENEQ